LPQITAILDALESFYGKQRSAVPTDPYEFLVWWHCGYPAIGERCTKGWQSVSSHELCKRAKPACPHCPLESNCAFARRSSKKQ
jgi:hypothetical protein